MDKFLADRIQLTVDNYRLVKEELRNDGDIINHFASLIFSHYEREIPIYRVKEIRKNIFCLEIIRYYPPDGLFY